MHRATYPTTAGTATARSSFVGDVFCQHNASRFGMEGDAHQREEGTGGAHREVDGGGRRVGQEGGMVVACGDGRSKNVCLWSAATGDFLCVCLCVCVYGLQMTLSVSVSVHVSVDSR